MISDALSQSTLDVEFYDIETAEPYVIRGGELKQRKWLVDIIRQKEKESDYATAYSSVIEEVAYTWFNRLIAVRFMEVNDYMPAHIRVLSSETGKLEPDIVTTPFDAELELSDVEKQQIIELKNENKLDECFRMLFIKQCKEATNTAYSFLKANAGCISGAIGVGTKDFVINYQDLQGLGMTSSLALPTLIALCSIAPGKPVQSSLAVLGEISISGTMIKTENLADTLQVCLDSGAKKVLLPQTSAVDLGTVSPDLMSSFNLIFYQSAEDAVFKALGVE